MASKYHKKDDLPRKRDALSDTDPIRDPLPDSVDEDFVFGNYLHSLSNPNIQIEHRINDPSVQKVLDSYRWDLFPSHGEGPFFYDSFFDDYFQAHTPSGKFDQKAHLEELRLSQQLEREERREALLDLIGSGYSREECIEQMTLHGYHYNERLYYADKAILKKQGLLS